MPKNTPKRQELQRMVQQELAAMLRHVATQLQAGRPLDAALQAAAAQLAPAPTGVLSSKQVAVLTAAAVAALQRPVRITRITPQGQAPASGWSEMGRMAIQISHNIRR